MYNRNYVHKNNLLGAGLMAFVAGAAVWAIFGRKMTESMEQNPKLSELKKQVYDKTSQMSDLTQEKYNAVVDEVSSKYAQARGISQNELKDLVDDLKWHWRRIKSSWNNNRYSDDDQSFN